MNSLKSYNTFGVDVQCAHLEVIESENQLITFLKDHPEKEKRIIGEGSNLLLVHDLDEVVLINRIKGISIIDENDDFVKVEVGGGENWHQFVIWALDHNLGGIENLSLIPGTVGAAPIQNIGAYGTEQESVFEYLFAVDMKDRTRRVFSKEDCQFGYRDSIFKSTFKGRYFITKVVYRLLKHPKINTSYGAIREVLKDWRVSDPDINDVSRAVIFIRQSKLPDPKIIGNSGSFFKNPIISRIHLEKLLHSFPEMPFYPIDNDQVKVPAGWLIEKCGWKGKKVGHTGTYKNQALVIVNHGGATGREILALSSTIRKSVRDSFDIDIQPEVNIWPEIEEASLSSY